MFKTNSFITILLGCFCQTYFVTSVAIYGQCGGFSTVSWTSPCDAGLNCCYQNQYYSQCLTTCPSDTLQASTTKTPVVTNTVVALYGQCGGFTTNSWTSACASGLSCCYQNKYYSQCLQSCSTTQASTGAPTKSTATTKATSTTLKTTQAPTKFSPTTKSGTSTTCSSFTNGVFKLGISYDQTSGCSTNLNGYDYITIWMDTIDSNQSTNFNPWYQGAMLNCCIKNGKIPLFYAYVIAFEARNMMGLQDCDVDPQNNLCHYGAQFIRNNRAYLVGRYNYQASEISKIVGASAKVVFLIEPDFWQYYGDPNQQGGGLTGAYMRSLFDDFVLAIKTHLPNAIISFDISAWLTQDGFKIW
jgi:hypothetical protein